MPNYGLLYDCGCVDQRPENSRLFGSRWKVYVNKKIINIRCLDCGRVHSFDLSREYVQRVYYGGLDDGKV